MNPRCFACLLGIALVLSAPMESVAKEGMLGQSFAEGADMAETARRAPVQSLLAAIAEPAPGRYRFWVLREIDNREPYKVVAAFFTVTGTRGLFGRPASYPVYWNAGSGDVSKVGQAFPDGRVEIERPSALPANPTSIAGPTDRFWYDTQEETLYVVKDPSVSREPTVRVDGKSYCLLLETSFAAKGGTNGALILYGDYFVDAVGSDAYLYLQPTGEGRREIRVTKGLGSRYAVLGELSAGAVTILEGAVPGGGQT